MARGSNDTPRQHDPLTEIVERDQTWPRMARKYGVENPVPPWKTSLDGMCDALDRAVDPDVPSGEQRRDDEDALTATLYSAVPFPESQLVSLAHSLLDRGLIGETELRERMATVRSRLEA
ncbi:thiocyanate hydrolase [Gordonia sp. OPL2]|uniref:thiocyanate hydrolase n=1 Tax=Gordonia sp. OPL2 TaxID=2486274 RepID=UPI0016554ED3|nr:thiocyanate hydrolase [Gordonia sp. OPL2]RPA19900.1 thiocyanate hydrolase [Gordonia sp. OPL2]